VSGWTPRPLPRSKRAARRRCSVCGHGIRDDAGRCHRCEFPHGDRCWLSRTREQQQDESERDAAWYRDVGADRPMDPLARARRRLARLRARERAHRTAQHTSRPSIRRPRVASRGRSRRTARRTGRRKASGADPPGDPPSRRREGRPGRGGPQDNRRRKKFVAQARRRRHEHESARVEGGRVLSLRAV
jgi:hypothetical protein